MSDEIRLIDANAFIEDIKTEAMNLYLDGMKGTPRPRSELYDIIYRIGEQPTVDAKPVVHGRWIRYEHGSGIYCSNCRHKRRYRDAHDNYCPNCGADMRERSEWE